jgi:hypothetical protein
MNLHKDIFVILWEHLSIFLFKHNPIFNKQKHEYEQKNEIIFKIWN